MKIRIVNGPNLNLLGLREPQVYGSQTYKDLCIMVEDAALKHGVQVEILQSNSESQLIDWIQEYLDYDALIINPAGFSHTSIALLDAIKAVNRPTIEVHISNIHKRDSLRHNLITAQGAQGLITGLGLVGYELAMTYLVKNFNNFTEES